MYMTAIYVHIPFCAKHCAYCDFNTYVEKAQSPLVRDTVDAMRRDIEQTAQDIQRAGGQPLIQTIFFGGGTPTFLRAEQLVALLQTIRQQFPVAAEAEITSEANPGTSDAEKFAAMREAGFNRLSIGVQSFDDALLVALDRFHTSGEAERAFQAAREAGFQNLNLDLMFGLPRQTLALWHATLERALALNTEHLSLYALTLEPGTRFERLHAGGKLPLPDEDAELAMYETCIETLTNAGYEHYEVSNFARPGFRSRHNQVYWHNEAYLGFGPGAVSYYRGRRWKRERLPLRYVQKIKAGEELTEEAEELSAEDALGETMMLGLRLREGISLSAVQKRFGIDPRLFFAEPIQRLIRTGYLQQENDRVRLTYRGLLFADRVAGEFLV
jgi:oxygen-independent coproporphyrinogen-3 oxidase